MNGTNTVTKEDNKKGEGRGYRLVMRHPKHLKRTWRNLESKAIAKRIIKVIELERGEGIIQ